MRKIFSLVIGACFLLNNVGFALCPPLISGSLAEDTHEYKFLIMAEVGLQDYLKSVDKFKLIANSRSEKFVEKAFKKHDRFNANETYYTENTVFNPATITVCSKEVKQIGEDSPIFMVPVFVEKNEEREDYRLLFSTVRDKDSGYPSTLCTFKEFNSIENEIKTRKILPQRDTESAKKLAEIKYQYLEQNDGIIDSFLEKRIKAKDFTEIENRVEKVLLWNKNTYPGRITPEKHLAKNHSDYIKTKLDEFLKIVDTDFNETFKNKNIVFIRVPEGTDFPIINQEQGGVDLEVTSHTSEHAVYLLLKEKDYDRLMAEANVTDDVKKILEEIVDDMAHEAGVIYRLPWILAQTGHNNSWRYSNGLDVLYDSREILLNGETRETVKHMYDQILDTVKPLVEKGPANLDHLVALGIHREYAAAKTPPSDKKTMNKIAQLIEASTELSDITDKFIKQAEWEPKLGSDTYNLLIASAKALPHRFNYNSTHEKALEKIFNTLPREDKTKKIALLNEKIDIRYIQYFFETLFGGCACKLTVAKHFRSPFPDNWKMWFNDPPQSANELMRITVNAANGKKNIAPKEFIINVAAGKTPGFDGVKIYVEAYSIETRQADRKTFSVKTDALSTKKGFIEFDKMIDAVLDASAPTWVENCISPNLNGLLRLTDKSALIFSEKVTFDGGVGRLLSKLAKADIKIAVIAKTDAQRNIIDYLNAVELEGTDNKILYGKTVAIASAMIKGVQNFSYFRIEEDGKEFIPKNVNVMKDLTVRQIIDALGKACGFVGEEMEKIYTAAELFAKAV